MASFSFPPCITLLLVSRGCKCSTSVIGPRLLHRMNCLCTVQQPVHGCMHSLTQPLSQCYYKITVWFVNLLQMTLNEHHLIRILQLKWYHLIYEFYRQDYSRCDLPILQLVAVAQRSIFFEFLPRWRDKLFWSSWNLTWKSEPLEQSSGVTCSKRHCLVAALSTRWRVSVSIMHAIDPVDIATATARRDLRYISAVCAIMISLEYRDVSYINTSLVDASNPSIASCQPLFVCN